jgi:hypothetical protein
VDPGPSPTPTTPTDDKHVTTKKRSAAGAVIGVLASLGVVFGGAFYYKRRRDAGAMSSAYKYHQQKDFDGAGTGSELFSGMSVNVGGFKPPTLREV